MRNTKVWARQLCLSGILILTTVVLHAQVGPPQNKDAVQVIGAEVFIEPGQTPAEVDGWFSVMEKSGMTVCRIRMFESYMHKPDDTWDFSLFDIAFKAAAKHHIHVFANIFPNTAFTDLGGIKFPKDDAELKSIANYVQKLVSHFKTFPALYGWVLLNEPGVSDWPDSEFTRRKFAEWKAAKTVAAYNSGGYPTYDFSREQFLVDYNTWFLGWIAAEIYKYDPHSNLHVNNHQIFQNVVQYNFPAWRKFLTTLGGSAHASWHFGYFKRSQYAMALSANCEIIRSGAGPLPFWITELQGGNNTYSAYNPLCPTQEEITQWIWTSIGSGAKGLIFWCLNPRATGIEAGEWALLDFQDQPSDRMLAAAHAAAVLQKYPDLFGKARVIEPAINLLYVREALWGEKALQIDGTKYEGRNTGGVMKSALGYYEALSELGVPCALKAIDEFDWDKSDYHGSVIILAHQIVIPSWHWQHLESFVSRGGKLLVDGLTAYYDENLHCVMKTGFPLQKLFGGNISEVKLIADSFKVALTDPALQLPGHLWRSTLVLNGGKPISYFQNKPAALRHSYGQGEVVWIPSLIGLGARKQGTEELAAFIKAEVLKNDILPPVYFEHYQPGMLMRFLRSGAALITIIINKNAGRQKVNLAFKGRYKPELIFADKGADLSGDTAVDIPAEGTIIIKWNPIN